MKKEDKNSEKEGGGRGVGRKRRKDCQWMKSGLKRKGREKQREEEKKGVKKEGERDTQREEERQVGRWVRTCK